MATTTTFHHQIGYTCNVEIVEDALSGRFGFSDASGLMTTLAQHVWCQFAGRYEGDDKHVWGTDHIKEALKIIRHRLDDMDRHLAQVTPVLDQMEKERQEVEERVKARQQEMLDDPDVRFLYTNS